jgi:hypothetical protein
LGVGKQWIMRSCFGTAEKPKEILITSPEFADSVTQFTFLCRCRHGNGDIILICHRATMTAPRKAIVLRISSQAIDINCVPYATVQPNGRVDPRRTWINNHCSSERISMSISELLLLHCSEWIAVTALR